jgi:hypothetical protein
LRSKKCLSTSVSRRTPSIGGSSRAGYLDDGLADAAKALEDLLARESFYREMPAIEQHTRAIEAE